MPVSENLVNTLKFSSAENYAEIQAGVLPEFTFRVL